MTPLQKRLSADYTLFNLNDPAVTRFYIEQLDYIIECFPYFRDIAVVASFFTTANQRFNVRFHQYLDRFLYILHTEEGTEDTLSALCCFGDEETQATPSTESRTSSSESLESSDDLPSSSYDSTEPTLPPLAPMVPLSRIVSRADLILHSRETVLRHVARILTAHCDALAISPSLAHTLIGLLDYDPIHQLLLHLLQQGLILPVLLQDSCILRIMHTSLKSLSALLEAVLYSSKNDIEDEEKFVDQVEEHTGFLLHRFLQIGVDEGCIQAISPEDNSEPFSKESSLNDKYKEHKNKMDETPKDGECKVDGLSDSNNTTNVNSTSKETEDSPNAKQPEVKDEHPPSTTGPGPFQTHTSLIDKEHTCPLQLASTIYKILHIICVHRNSIEIRNYKILKICRFSLYYLRLLSFYRSPSSPSFISHLVPLFFNNPSNSHLLISVSRILLRTAPSILKETPFFDLLYHYCYLHIARTKAIHSEIIPPSLPQHLVSLGISPPQSLHSLFAFLIRLYLSFSAFIKAHYPRWDVFCELMDRTHALEKAKYTDDDLQLLTEYDGFQRYVLEYMLCVIPQSSIFNKEE